MKEGGREKGKEGRREDQEVPEEEPGRGNGGGGDGDEVPRGRSWWQWTDQTPEGSLQPRPSKALHYTGVAETTIPFLKQALAEHAPDGLLAFSQGATAAAILLAALQRDEREGKGQKEGVSLPKFAILVGGFFPRDEAVGQGVREGAPRLPTMFVGGAADQLVPLTRTRELMACWAEAEEGWITLHEHGGGHFVPTWKGEFKDDVVRFVDRFTSGEGIKGR